MNKVTYCKLTGCGEKCLSPGAGYICAAIGSGAVGVYTAFQILGGMAYFRTSGLDWALVAPPAVVVAIAMIVSIYLSGFERFDHWYSAVLFGASIPSFLVAISSINTPG
jgi:hypothetical protein